MTDSKSGKHATYELPKYTPIEPVEDVPQPMRRDDPKQGRFHLFYTPGLKGKPIIRVVAEDMVATFLVPNDAPKPNVLARYALKPEDQGKPIAELEQLYPYKR